MKFLLFILLLLCFEAQSTEIKVSVDRNPVNLNDSFQLVFSSDGDPDDDPDFAPLQQNFEIINQQRSSNSSWINGKSSRNEQWVLHLLAKQAGELLIPPISFGKDQSKPLRINVTNQNATVEPQNDAEIFLEVSATPEKSYVQSQIIYTLRLFRRVQLTQARLDEPQLKEAVVEKLGDDSNYTTQIQGVDYWVTERKYAIFPQQSGDLSIAPLTLTADVLSQRHSRFNGFFSQQMTETRRVNSKAINLQVLPVPASFKHNAWLSAESLELTEEWSNDSLQVTVGEPLTRTIRLTAKATTVGQLPELVNTQNLDKVKIYPDQPVLKEDKQTDGLQASREEKIAYIPNKPGDYTLPALDIHWFNTKTQQIEIAHLDPVTIKALPGKDNAQTSAPVSMTPASPATTTSAIQTSNDSNALLIWQGVSIFLGLGWLITLYLYWRRPRVKSGKPVTADAEPATLKSIDKRLQRACQENNPQAAKQALLQWGKADFGCESLGNLANNCKAPLRDEIELLNQYLYAGLTINWNGEALWQAFLAHQRPASVKTDANDALEPLYKL